MTSDPLPLRPPLSARDLGATAVLAPYPDGEALTCGGLLALLAAAGAPARLVVLSGRPDAPAECLDEERAALAALGLGQDAVMALRLPAGGLPEAGTAAFDRAADALAGALRGVETVLVPCPHDCDADHAATWELARAAGARLDDPPRWLEYLAPGSSLDELGAAWRLDIRPVLQRKRRALATIRSATASRRASDAPWEVFVEAPRPWIHRERAH